MNVNIISVVMLVLYLAVFVWQLNLINTLKSKLDVLEKFQSIFDVKKVEDYVSLINKKHSHDLHNAVHDKLNKEVKSIIKNHVGNVPDELKKQWQELLYMICVLISEWPESEIEDFLTAFPLNEDQIRHVLISYANKNL